MHVCTRKVSYWFTSIISLVGSFESGSCSLSPSPPHPPPSLLNASIYQMVPTEVKGVLEHKKIVGVACGGDHTAALMKDGKGGPNHMHTHARTHARTHAMAVG